MYRHMYVYVCMSCVCVCVCIHTVVRNMQHVEGIHIPMVHGTHIHLFVVCLIPSYFRIHTHDLLVCMCTH